MDHRSCKSSPARLSLIALSLLFPGVAASIPPMQDPSLIRETAVGFLHAQAVGLPGKAEIALGPLDSRLNLPPCAALEPSFPPGSRAWGSTTVVVRCTAPNPWTVYIRATVKVIAEHVVSAKPLNQGHVLMASDLILRRGDLTQLPPGIIMALDQAYGKTLTASLPGGSPLRQDVLRGKAAVIQSQVVKLISSGRGFSVSGEGRALNNAEDGQLVKVRSASGSLVSGIARPGAIVEVSY